MQWIGIADHDGAVEIPVSPLTSEIIDFYFLFFQKVDISLNIGDTEMSTAPSWLVMPNHNIKSDFLQIDVKSAETLHAHWIGTADHDGAHFFSALRNTNIVRDFITEYNFISRLVKQIPSGEVRAVWVAWLKFHKPFPPSLTLISCPNPNLTHQDQPSLKEIRRRSTPKSVISFKNLVRNYQVECAEIDIEASGACLDV